MTIQTVTKDELEKRKKEYQEYFRRMIPLKPVDPFAHNVYQVEANKFMLGRPEKAFGCMSLDDQNPTIKERFLKRFFPDRYADHMANLFSISTGRFVVRMNESVNS